MDYRKSGADIFSWGAVFFMAFCLLGKTFFKVIAILAIVLPLAFVFWIVGLFIKGWRNYGDPPSDR